MFEVYYQLKLERLKDHATGQQFYGFRMGRSFTQHMQFGIPDNQLIDIRNNDGSKSMFVKVSGNDRPTPELELFDSLVGESFSLGFGEVVSDREYLSIPAQCEALADILKKNNIPPIPLVCYLSHDNIDSAFNPMGQYVAIVLSLAAAGALILGIQAVVL